MDRSICPVRTYVLVGQFRLSPRRIRSVLPSARRPHQPEPMQPVTEPLAMLLDSVLHYLRPVPDRAEMRVHPAHHRLGLVAELAGHGIGGDRRALVERLQACRAPIVRP